MNDDAFVLLPRLEPTLALDESVYEVIRAQIIEGSLAPRLPLPLVPLADRLGVSTMPVRSALRRLQDEGLVVQLPRRGAVVAPLELEDLEEIQAIRTGLEGFAARVGAPLLTAESVEQMEGLLTEVQDYATGGDLDKYLSAVRQLHEICYAATGRPRLVRLIRQHERRAERYIRVAVARTRGLHISAHFQEQLVRACRQRDGGQAEEVIRQALAWTVDQVGQLLSADVSG